MEFQAFSNNLVYIALADDERKLLIAMLEKAPLLDRQNLDIEDADIVALIRKLHSMQYSEVSHRFHTNLAENEKKNLYDIAACSMQIADLGFSANLLAHQLINDFHQIMDQESNFNFIEAEHLYEM